MSNALSPIDKARAALWKKMPTEVQKIATDFEEKIGKGNASNMKINYDIGARCNEVHEGNEEKYGSGAIKQLAEYLNIAGGENGLRQRMTLAKVYSREYLATQCAIPMANGVFLSMGHWVALAQLADETNREKVLEETRKKSLSSNDLERTIRAKGAGDTKNARQGGRKPKSPTSPILGLQKTFEIANRFFRWEEVANKSTFGLIDELAPDKIDERLLEKAEATLEIVGKASKAADEMTTAIETNIERIKDVLAKRAEAAAEAADTDGETESKPKSAKKVGKNGKATAEGGKKKKKKKKKVPVAAE